MNDVATALSVESQKDHAELSDALHQQRMAFRQSGQEDYHQRCQHLKSLKRLLLDNQADIIAAINRDYGNRSYHETLIAEVITVVSDIDHTLKHLKKWMRVQRRGIDRMLYPGAKNRVIPQAVGVVGLIIPWNFPLNLGFSGLVAAFAAGNRAMVKMSENSVHLSELLIRLAPDYFSADKLRFFTETGNVGVAFSRLPFDHLMFTGSGQTGRKVMAAAAENLTPVTLELGGKSPAVIDPEYPLAKAVERLMFVKQFNAGQICTTVDYVFVHEGQLNAFVAEVKRWVGQHCPDIHSTDYTSVIDDRAFQRLLDTLADARDKGAEVVNLNGQEPDSASRKLPLTLILSATDEMIISQRETFGPILMVKTYTDPQDVIDYVNDRDRPLALYPFSNNKQLVDRYIGNILSGGVSVNDALFHVGQHDLPFGGIGGSGMGHYHGYEGFLTFSKLRPVFYQAAFSPMKYLMPPYGKTADRMLGLIAKLKL
ncbi:coniferyl aldehyde dehydrogenase [Oceanospirillum linum]|uniref:Aldehyde dehydrogenase n=1 Tax=Oceanospirillum linum TaxID=966 RepID=A0A1T1HAN3_OCELI|nr:coniferyl aldehyde dehydrogenase [Oceanospirillum linum]OOV86885.1 coniferyl-aldehyde dehydrogenase [Oceanospirillum linum]SEG19952.1 coniferyl-aldehyde dehydrogenase [Oleiphilus messinensis]SMP24334.1 coniferyl-aldehyde dehydrogenase [Oceanospirillum linum]